MGSEAGGAARGREQQWFMDRVAEPVAIVGLTGEVEDCEMASWLREFADQVEVNGWESAVEGLSEEEE